VHYADPGYRYRKGQGEVPAGPYVKLQIVELAEEKRPHPSSPANESAAMEKEGERILAVIPGGSFIITLDVKGESRSSGDLAALFGERELSGQNPLAFVIGGDLGLSPVVIARSNLRLSLSHMTFTGTGLPGVPDPPGRAVPQMILKDVS
jgi:23S rRNA (pseudouridine1915-N3)-methyltransferase